MNIPNVNPRAMVPFGGNDSFTSAAGNEVAAHVSSHDGALPAMPDSILSRFLAEAAEMHVPGDGGRVQQLDGGGGTEVVRVVP